MINKQASKKNKGGRPRKEINFEQLRAMVGIQCTADECCSVLGVSEDTIDRRVREEGYEGFADFYKKHSDEGKLSLRRMQWKSAQNGNVTMQIWLGKQMLNQKDKNETSLSGADGGPIRVGVVEWQIVRPQDKI